MSEPVRIPLGTPIEVRTKAGDVVEKPPSVLEVARRRPEPVDADREPAVQQDQQQLPHVLRNTARERGRKRPLLPADAHVRGAFDDDEEADPWLTFAGDDMPFGKRTLAERPRKTLQIAARDARQKGNIAERGDRVDRHRDMIGILSLGEARRERPTCYTLPARRRSSVG